MNGENYTLLQSEVKHNFEEDRCEITLRILLDKEISYDIKEITKHLWICVPTSKVLHFYSVWVTREYEMQPYGDINTIDVEFVVLDELLQSNTKSYATGYVWLFEAEDFTLYPNCNYTFNKIEGLVNK